MVLYSSWKFTRSLGFWALFRPGIRFFWEILPGLGFALATHPYLPLLGSSPPPSVSTKLCTLCQFCGNWSTHSAVSFFYGALKETLEIQVVPVDKMAIVFILMTPSSRNLVKMCKIRFCSQIKNKILFTYLQAFLCLNGYPLGWFGPTLLWHSFETAIEIINCSSQEDSNSTLLSCAIQYIKLFRKKNLACLPLRTSATNSDKIIGCYQQVLF